MAQSEGVQLLRRLDSCVSVLDIGEQLADSSDDVRGLSESVLLAQANSGSSVEGQVLPASRALLSPSLRSELVAVLAPELLSSVHREDVVDNGVSLSDKDRLGLVGSSSSGKSGISRGVSDVKRNRRIESQSLVDDKSQVLASLKTLKGDLGEIAAVTKVLVNLGSQLLPHLGVSGQLVDDPGQNTGGGVSASKQNVEGLVSQNSGSLTSRASSRRKMYLSSDFSSSELARAFST